MEINRRLEAIYSYRFAGAEEKHELVWHVLTCSSFNDGFVPAIRSSTWGGLL